MNLILSLQDKAQTNRSRLRGPQAVLRDAERREQEAAEGTGRAQGAQAHSIAYVHADDRSGGHHRSYTVPFVREGHRSSRRSDCWILHCGGCAQGSVLEPISSICSLLNPIHTPLFF